MPRDATLTREVTHFHFCCGIGGAAKGFNKANPRVGAVAARFRCLGGVDVSPSAIRDFDRLVGVPGTVMDLFTREQYTAFHGKEPPADWREMGPADIRRAAGNERPNIVFISSPCKGASGLLSETMSQTPKYQALNELTLRCIWLMAEAWADDPVDLIVFENVPRLATRGRHLLDQINQVLQSYGYAVAETTHDCGELGGLAQSRKRFLLVARHAEKVPPFLYEPDKKRLRAVGDVLGRMPFPGDEAGGPMHRIPRLQWKTWVRLAFVEAGSDWRSLNRLAVENGHLRDYLIVPEMHRGVLGVNEWEEPIGTVTSRGMPMNGNFAVADPRHMGPAKHSNELRVGEWDDAARVVSGAHGTGQCIADPRYTNSGDYGQLGVRSWEEPTGTITAQRSPIQGGFSVADPRAGGADTHKNVYRIVPWSGAAGTVTSGQGPSSGGGCVADPRSTSAFDGAGKYLVTPFSEPAGTVIGASTTGQGAFAVADPRTSLNMNREKGDAYLTGGHYGVVPWDSPSGAVSAAARQDNGRWSVADPRALPALDQKTVAIIRSLDGTWHRPFTTLELAALQSLIEPEEYLLLDGASDSVWREHIGNLVPPDAATAIAEVMGTTLLLAWGGETFVLSATPIWVRNVALALTMPGEARA
ncbi:DNA cytosine methyltransferase [Massilia varians]|uniref:DNA cytosine methyltransferase n=1 Tax=Massilia varians TaxID=457921 RepID=UPI002554EFB8|nr:DNA cytosine methyltransferase [Massilia varians]MDK6077907.1 DNA cytosine methyltransferase [Massilia varians]